MYRGPFLATAIAALSACTTVGPDFTPPALPGGVENADFVSASSPYYLARPPAAAWWRDAGDENLSWMIDEALAANLDLQIAAANVRGARALLRQERTNRAPTVTASAEGAAAQASNAAGGFPDVSADVTSPSALGLDLAWELDLFGRIDRLVEGAEAGVAEAEALQDDTKRLVAAEVALAYTDLQEAQLRLDIAERNLTLQSDVVEITEVLTDAGRISDIDLVRARAQRSTTAAGIPSLRAQERAALNRLSTLLGQTPGALDERLGVRAPPPSLPAFVAVGDPASLIRRRPDIRAAERSLARDTAAIGVATADLFPRVSLGANVGLSAAEIADLGSAGAPGFSLGPSLTWNVFDRSGIYARIEQAEAGADARLAAYQQTVLVALEETETAMSDLTEEQLRLASLRDAAANSSEAADLALIRYEAGSEAFLSVLDSQRTLLDAEDQVAISRANQSRSLIRLYRALGGEWPSDQEDENRSQL